MGGEGGWGEGFEDLLLENNNNNKAKHTFWEDKKIIVDCGCFICFDHHPCP